MDDRYVGIGEFIKTHGIFGELLFAPYNSDTDAIESEAQLFIYKNNIYALLEIEKIRRVNKGYLFKLSGVHSIEEASKYKKVTVFIKKADIILNDGEYLISDLIGMKCYNKSGLNLGMVTEIYSGETDIMEITSAKGTYMIPMADYNILSIDTENFKIIVENEKNCKL
jgi:16S rRNA processing protein RimM